MNKLQNHITVIAIKECTGSWRGQSSAFADPWKSGIQENKLVQIYMQILPMIEMCWGSQMPLIWLKPCFWGSAGPSKTSPRWSHVMCCGILLPPPPKQKQLDFEDLPWLGAYPPSDVVATGIILSIRHVVLCIQLWEGLQSKQFLPFFFKPRRIYFSFLFPQMVH